MVPNPKFSEEVEAARKEEEELLRRYDNEPEIKELADQIHSARLMPGPACCQCIEAAIARLCTK